MNEKEQLVLNYEQRILMLEGAVKTIIKELKSKFNCTLQIDMVVPSELSQITEQFIDDFIND